MMKVLTYIIIAVLLLSSCSCEEYPNSWEAYCALYGVNSENPTDEQINYYLDCFCGSVECENLNIEENEM